MDVLVKEFRMGLRALVKTPQFTLTAILFLALGIGGNAAMFSVVNAVMLRPMPYEDPERLVFLGNVDLTQADPQPTLLSTFEFATHKATSEGFESIGAVEPVSFNLTGVAEPRQIDGARVSSDVLPMLLRGMHQGRYFAEGEDRPGGEPVAVVSHTFWLSELAGEASTGPQTLTLEGVSHTVIGVLPPGFRIPFVNAGIWTPLRLNPADTSVPARRRRYLLPFARLKDGVSLQQAEDNLQATMAGLAEQYPDSNTDMGARLDPMREVVVAQFRPRIVMLQVAAGFVLLIVCANLTHLLLMRTFRRSGEIAVRSALGASRFQLLRQIFIESLILALAGGVLAVLLTYWGLSSLLSLSPLSASPMFQGAIGVDPVVLGFSLLLTFVTAVLCTLAPWLLGFRLRLQDLLKEGGGRSASGKSRRVLEGLAMMELAMALVLVVGAGLMLRSFDQLKGAETGFPTDDTLVMRITLPEARYADAASRSGFVDRVLAGVEGLPGVGTAGITTAMPMRGAIRFGTFVIEGREPSDRLVYERLSLVSPHFLRALGVRVIEGRPLGEQDHAGAPGVAVLSESFVRKHFPGEASVLGQRIQRGRRHDPEQPFFTVVGVVSDVRFSPQAGQIDPSYFLSYSQRAAKPQATQLELLVRLGMRGAVNAKQIQQEVWKVDRGIAISAISDLETVVADTLGDARFSTFLATLFGGLAFLLGLAGVYGVIVQFVQQRHHEIGVRMAMGAAANDILGMILKRGFVLVASGVAIGLVGAFALTRLIEGQLYQVSTLDPTTLVAATAILVVAALLAFAIPARRATRVSPMITLRSD